MKVHIQTVGIDLTDALESYIEKKFELVKRLLARPDSRGAVSARIEIGKTTKHRHAGELFKAEAHITLGKHQYNAEEVKDDLYAAIDAVKDELSREITAHKDRKQTMKTRGGRKLKKMLKGLKKVELKL